MIRRVVLAFALLALVGVLCAPHAEGQEPASELERAKELMRQVPLIDGHNDLPWALRTDYGMDWDSLDISRRQLQLMTDIPRLRAGLVGAQFWSTYVPSSFGGNGAGRAGVEENDIVHRMVERYPEVFELAGTADDILRIHREGKIASLLGLEGGHMIALTHSRNTDWADAATDSLEHGGLTRFGEEVVKEMNRLGMLVDISHASDSTAWDVLRVTEAPVVLSHSSSRRFTPHPRNIPDDLAAAVGENGGVIMVNFVLPFIYLPAYQWYEQRRQMRAQYREVAPSMEAAADSLAAWQAANPRPLPDLRVVADHIEHLRDVAGVDHVGIGSDFDGIEVPPEGLEDVSKYPELIAELLRRGWSDEDAMKVIGVNLLRVMKEAEKVAERLQLERPPSAAQIETLDGWDTAPPWRSPNP
jgi:membrane dipeptidase